MSHALEADVTTADEGGDPFAGVVGQRRAVDELRAALRAPVHAYLLVGPRGSGKQDLALAFAAGLLASGTGEDASRHLALALAGRHPDLVIVRRVGASITADQARGVRDEAQRAPVEGARKVMVLDEFHLVQDNVGPMLLKTIEEPPPTTVFVLLMEDVPPSMETIESRCVRVDLGPVAVEAIEEQLRREGVADDVAREAATAAVGDLRRARVLATDPELADRRWAWFTLPERLDGSGAAATDAVDDVLARIDDAAGPLVARQAGEREALEARVEQYGERGSGRRELDDRHKRELRRHRTDEIRFGLAILAGRYRDAAVTTERPHAYIDAVAAIQVTAEGLIRNPNERLQLLALVMQLPTLRSG